MDSNALPIFLGLVGCLFLLFCFGAVFTSAAAIRLTAATLMLPVAPWRKLFSAGLLCGAVYVAFFLAVQSETLERLDLVWQTVSFLALIGVAVVSAYLQDLFTASIFRSVLLATLAFAAFAGTCALGVATAFLFLSGM